MSSRVTAAVRPLLIPPQPSIIDFERLALFVNAAADAAQRRRERRDYARADQSLLGEMALATEFLALGL